MKYHKTKCNLDRRTNQITARQSNIELLRIIAIIMIIGHHFSVHGGFDFSTQTITINRLWIQFIQIGGKIGVDVFILISGYFLVSATLKIKKVIRLWFQIFTYSTVIFFVFVILSIEPFNLKELIKHILPITFSQWWFASSYFILYLISPYVNKLLNVFDKKCYQRFLTLLTFCWCIIPTLLSVSWQCNSLLWFVYLYALAGYIRLHANSIPNKGKSYLIISFTLILFTFLITVIFDFLGRKILFFGTHATYFYDMQRLPILLISLSLFIGFLKIDIGYKPIINILSSATFGIYLIHDNRYIRSFLWKTVFKNSSFAESNILIPYSIIVILLVFIVCATIELLRIYILERRYLKIIDTLSNISKIYIDRFFSLKFFDKL